MSNAMKHGHQPEHAEYEREDLTARSVFSFLIGLAVMGVLVFVFLKVMVGVLESYNRTHQPVQNPLAAKSVPVPENSTLKQAEEGIDAAFPTPRLEKEEFPNLREFREAEEQKLYSYGWVDQNAGTVHIPIDRAMELIAQRGLPTQIKTGATPSSTVNAIQQAAEKPDVAVKAKAKKKK